MRAWLPVLIAAAAGLIVLLVNAYSHLPFMSDDAFISFRYGQRLLEGGGLTWTDGPRVEGYTNFLWLMACTGLAALGLDFVDAARLLGVTSMAVALVGVAWAVRPRRLADAIPATAATVSLALTGAFGVWAIGGLEQPFIAAFLAWAIALLIPLLNQDFTGRARFTARVLGAGLLLGLLCLSRADGPVLCVAIGSGLLIALSFSARAWRTVLLIAVFPLLMTAGQVLFRWLYYGDLVPNSARVKVAFSTHRLSTGLAYVAQGGIVHASLILPAVIALCIAFTRPDFRRRAIFLAIAAAVWLGYVAFIGGDIFPARRQWVAALIPIALLAAELLRLVRLHPAWGQAAGPALAAVMLLATWFQQSPAREPAIMGARLERWEWDGQAVGEMLKRAFGDQRPLLAVDPAGALPFYSELPALDMLGLNDRHIAHTPAPAFGQGWMGHELGDGKYVLDRKPDLIVFEVPAGRERAFFPSGKQMQGDPNASQPADPRFAELYRLIQYEAPRDAANPIKGQPIKAVIWTRIEDSPIGIQRTATRVTVPGFLLAAPPDPVARLDKQGRLACVVSITAAGYLPRVELAEDRWRVTADADGPLTLEVRPAGSQRVLFSGPPPGEFVLIAGGGDTIDILARSTSRAEVREVAFERQ